MEKKIFKTKINQQDLIVEVGELAKQADGAVLVRYGQTTVLSCAVVSDQKSDSDFFPLTINYQEKMYAAGKFPGGFIKREGKPSEHATLTARLIDRPMRPLFEEDFKNEVQITNTVFSLDPECSPELAAMLGSSLAVSISKIPFAGPIAGVRVGKDQTGFILNPTDETCGDLDLTVAGTSQAIDMVEAGANQLTETQMLDAIMFGFEAIKKLCAFEDEIIAAVGTPKMSYEKIALDDRLAENIEQSFAAPLKEAMETIDKKAREQAMEQVRQLALAQFVVPSDGEQILQQFKTIWNHLTQKVFQEMVLVDHKRADGRQMDEIRPLTAKAGFLPRVHGSGLFTRGQTQVLSVLTLAPLSEGQTVDDLRQEHVERFMHQYNFPPYSVGEIGRYGAPGRRELGHGHLGQRALQAVLPSENAFPYAVRLVAEVLESNGSSSQASICAGTLALMDGGVPIKAPVAGIAMGLVEADGQKEILTDIQGLEDHLGSMDCKVAGTTNGITSLQMDLKVAGLEFDLLKEIFAKAKTARQQILAVIKQELAAPRPQLSPYAPKIDTMQIAPDQIKVVIGKGGDTINKIIAQTGVKIDIDETGMVQIASSDQMMIDQAKTIIKQLTKKAQVGEIYQAKVTRLEKYGVFVELFKGSQALLRKNDLTPEMPFEQLKIGQVLTVKVKEIDAKGRINVGLNNPPKKNPIKPHGKKLFTIGQ